MTANMEQSSSDDLVSIIMPTFNSRRTVDRAIDSVLAQTHAHWQLVWIDDASTDETAAHVLARREELGPRLITKRLDENRGPAHARNQGLDLCEGDWVAVLDADDAWRPERLETLLAVATARKADGVCDNLMGLDDHRHVETQPLFVSLPMWLTLPLAVAAEYQGRYNLGYLKPIVRRAFLTRMAIRYDEALRTGEDLVLLLQITARRGRITCVSTASYIYTMPFGDVSRKLSRTSSTVPRDRELASALQRFVEENGAAMQPHETAAVLQRISYLAAIATFSQFRHARLSRDWNTALRLLKHRDVRRRLVKYVLFDRWTVDRRSHVETL